MYRLTLAIALCAALPGCGLFWPARVTRFEKKVDGSLVFEREVPMFTEDSDTEAVASRPAADGKPGEELRFKTKQNISDANYAATRQKEAEQLKALGEALIKAAESKLPNVP